MREKMRLIVPALALMVTLAFCCAQPVSPASMSEGEVLSRTQAEVIDVSYNVSDSAEEEEDSVSDITVQSGDSFATVSYQSASSL